MQSFSKVTPEKLPCMIHLFDINLNVFPDVVSTYLCLIFSALPGLILSCGHIRIFPCNHALIKNLFKDPVWSLYSVLRTVGKESRSLYAKSVSTIRKNHFTLVP